MSIPIPDFDDAQITRVKSRLRAHFGKPVELHLADSEIALTPADQALTLCPVVVWQAADCQFALLRAGEARYRGQYFCEPDNMQTTPQVEFNTLEDCLEALLRAQKAYVAEKYAQISAQINQPSTESVQADSPAAGEHSD